MACRLGGLPPGHVSQKIFEIDVNYFIFSLRIQGNCRLGQVCSSALGSASLGEGLYEYFLTVIVF